MSDARQEAARLDAKAALLDHYPNLRRSASLARRSADLRDEAHELIARFQKRSAPLILSVGRKAVDQGVLTQAEEVFDLDLEEFVVLVRDMPRAGYLGRTMWRRAELECAEQALATGWKSRGALSSLWTYKDGLEPVLGCLAVQSHAASEAGHATLSRWYIAESERLKSRTATLFRLAKEEGKRPESVGRELTADR